MGKKLWGNFRLINSGNKPYAYLFFKSVCPVSPLPKQMLNNAEFQNVAVLLKLKHVCPNSPYLISVLDLL